ncbi:IMP cyclohydrolase [Candidatus Woesearchaeota archaeon]|nr:IMP cyclohydrolase [Candidatus Woesearchaeota archaeon]
MKRGTDVTDMKRVYRNAVQDDFPEAIALLLEKEYELRYGENPNQSAGAYKIKGTSIPELTNIRLLKSGKGGLSATNLMDVTRALDILKFFKSPAVAVMKHVVPSGFATQFNNNNLEKIYQNARDADARSAFGSIVVMNQPLDKATANAINQTYVEGVAAPDYEEGAVEILQAKKDLRLILFSNLEKIPKYAGDDVEGLYDIKILPTGRAIVQKPYLSSIKGPESLILDPLVRKKDEKTGIETAYVVEKDPAPRELEDLLTSWYVNIGVRSNGIVIVKDGVTLAIGSGQQERVGAVEQAITKSYQKALDRKKMLGNANVLWTPGSMSWDDMRKELESNPLEGAVLSSDAFFPFRDSIDLIAGVGIKAIIQPGGSVKDYEVIQAVNEHKIAMAYTLERCFGHF